MHWESKILVNCPPQKRPFFSMKKGWPYKRETSIPKQIPCFQQNHGLWYVFDKLVYKMATENNVTVCRSIMFSPDSFPGKMFPHRNKRFSCQSCYVKTPKHSVFSMYIINIVLNDQWYIDSSPSSELWYFSTQGK
jgi:hypothetical protein